MAAPFSTRMSTRTIFADPWRRPSSPPRPVRSDSAASDPTSGASAPQTRSASVASACYPPGYVPRRSASLGVAGSASSSRRSSCFSILEAEEERAEFGAQVVGLLEPRTSVGWWGMKEVLEEPAQE